MPKLIRTADGKTTVYNLVDHVNLPRKVIINSDGSSKILPAINVAVGYKLKKWDFMPMLGSIAEGTLRRSNLCSPGSAEIRM